MKFDISKANKTYHFEAEADLTGKKLGEKVRGGEVLKELGDYELEISGASDKAGFPMLNVEGAGRKRLLLKFGKGMKERKPRGLRKRKTVVANTITAEIAQVNLKVLKQGSKPLEEIFKKEGKEEKREEKIEEKK